MQIEIGKYYVNKTWKYLLPTLKEYGSTFNSKFNTVFKLAVGYHDGLLDGTKFEEMKLIYVLIDKKWKPQITQNIMQWFKYQPFTMMDYAFDDIEDGRKHMFVFRVPDKYHDAYDEFRKGNYSRMYTEKQLEQLFIYESQGKEVLMRTEEAYLDFAEKIYNSFESTVTKADLLGAELDFPPTPDKDTFNFKKGD
jgi:hypothetical protein